MDDCVKKMRPHVLINDLLAAITFIYDTMVEFPFLIGVFREMVYAAEAEVKKRAG